MQDKFADIDDSQSLRRESQGIFDNRDAAGGSGGAQDDEETSLVATVAQFVWFWLSCTTFHSVVVAAILLPVLLGLRQLEWYIGLESAKAGATQLDIVACWMAGTTMTSGMSTFFHLYRPGAASYWSHLHFGITYILVVWIGSPLVVGFGMPAGLSRQGAIGIIQTEMIPFLAFSYYYTNPFGTYPERTITAIVSAIFLISFANFQIWVFVGGYTLSEVLESSSSNVHFLSGIARSFIFSASRLIIKTGVLGLNQGYEKQYDDEKAKECNSTHTSLSSRVSHASLEAINADRIFSNEGIDIEFHSSAVFMLMNTGIPAWFSFLRSPNDSEFYGTIVCSVLFDWLFRYQSYRRLLKIEARARAKIEPTEHKLKAANAELGSHFVDIPSSAVAEEGGEPSQQAPQHAAGVAGGSRQARRQSEDQSGPSAPPPPMHQRAGESRAHGRGSIDTGVGSTTRLPPRSDTGASVSNDFADAGDRQPRHVRIKIAGEAASHKSVISIGRAERMRGGFDSRGRVRRQREQRQLEALNQNVVRAYKLLAIQMRSDIAGSTAAIITACMAIALFISSQPGLQACNSKSFVSINDIGLRVVVVLVIQLISDTACLTLVMRMTKIPILLSASVKMPFVQGTLCAVAVGSSMLCTAIAYERGLIFPRKCSLAVAGVPYW
ncbi:hypothetical protein HK105_200263 [Polyrhizophydium stewartii]|uniref:Uncharacterized protein n=1 Tax=Polyrhizophydium stewartii TaxID=2732419 RepID=A0ABR4NL02_9FUNG